jgi:hypothetical protein
MSIKIETFTGKSQLCKRVLNGFFQYFGLKSGLKRF